MKYDIKIILTAFFILFLASSLKSNDYELGYFSHEVITSDTISEGIIYKHILIGKKQVKHSVRVIEAEIIKFNDIAILKAGKTNQDLAKIQDMMLHHDSTNKKNKLIAAVNGNFWRGESNYPIGPTIVDGEVIEKYRYKKWTSFFVDSQGLPYIDTFDIKTSILLGAKFLDIPRVNRRMNNEDIILYNRYYGNELPKPNQREILTNLTNLLEVMRLDSTQFYDSTEAIIDSSEILENLIKTDKELNFEFSTFKVQLIYLDKPQINKDIECMVSLIDTGAVQIPDSGCVLSFGSRDISQYDIKLGDILILRHETNILPNTKFISSVCGTPRLVRHGIANHEAYLEGSKGKRFISKQLARTAIGYDQSKTKVYFVTVDQTSLPTSKKGANLNDLAWIMKSLGCYDAMNLDGGGSSYMVIDDDNFKYNSFPGRGRRVTTAIGVKNK